MIDPSKYDIITFSILLSVFAIRLDIKCCTNPLDS